MLCLRTILAGVLAVPLGLAAQGNGSKEAPSAYSVSSPMKRMVVIRLKNKTDMLEGIREVVAREKIKNAVIVSGFGSVTKYHIHVVANTTFPPVDTFTKGEGAFDLVGVSGMIIGGRVHAHITLAATDKMTGGHLEPGTSVFTFANITLGVLDDSADLSRIDDYTWH